MTELSEFSVREDGTVIVGEVVFSTGRIAKQSEGKTDVAIRTEDVREVRVANDSISEHPIREVISGFVIGGFGVSFVFGQNIHSIDLNRGLGALICVVVAAWIFLNLFRTATMVCVHGREGKMARIRLATKLSKAQLTSLNTVLRDRLNYPVKGSAF